MVDKVLKLTFVEFSYIFGTEKLSCYSASVWYQTVQNFKWQTLYWKCTFATASHGVGFLRSPIQVLGTSLTNNTGKCRWTFAVKYRSQRQHQVTLISKTRH